MIQQQSLPPAVHAHGRTDEDFINRSLLDQIDTDADTDPVFSSDSEAVGASASFRNGGMHGPRDYGSSSSQSSVESSGFPYQMMNPRGHVPPRSDSPNGQRSNLVYSSQNDQMVHTPQQMLYNNPGAEQPSDFGHFANSDGNSATAFDSATLRSNSMYATFGPSRGRQGVPGSSSTGMSNDPGANFGQFPGDVFGSLGGSQQQQLTNGMRGAFDYMRDGSKNDAKQIFSGMDPFNSNPLLQSQNQPLSKQMQAQQQQFHLQNLGQPYVNNMMQGPQQATSQAPFGPHVNPANNGPLTHANGLGNVSVTNQQEEISTIFVVGFPEDMQEREFQNMFTFSSGFEAATLKIPNKDSTAYGANAPSAASATQQQRGAFQLGYPFNNGANDPYNLLTVNQGGVVVDGRDGTTSSWPIMDTNDPNANNGQGNQGPPRKQIIGFAKFRTRAEALAARDLLQGRRVDIEKGAVLKAEMAKKNLHTKRGLGPLGAPLSVNVGGSSAAGSGTTSAAGAQGPNGANAMNMGSIAENLQASLGMLSPTVMNGPDLLGSRDLAAMGMAELNRRDRSATLDDDREVRRRMGSVSVLTNGLNAISLNLQGQRGPRERLEEDEREREKRRKERDSDRTPLRTNPTFDAFHNARLPTSQQPLSASILSPSESMSAFPFSGAPLFSPHESISGLSDGWPAAVSAAQQQKFQSRGSIAQMPPLGITTTNIAKPHPPSSMESSPTEANSDPIPAAHGPHAENPLPHTHDPELFSPKTSVPLSSHPSMSSLGSRSRPYSPPIDVPPVPFPEQFLQGQSARAQGNQVIPPSSASSISESRSSSSSVDEELSRTFDAAVSQQRGAMSPQLPSPNSGGSSRTNLSDQNPPINTLYVGNLPTSPAPGNTPTVLEDNLRSLFQRCAGYRKLCYRQKSNGPMCFVEFDDVSFATRALGDLYGNTLNGLVKGGIRLSYSKNPLGVRTPTNTANGSGLHQPFGSGSFSSLQEAFSRHNNPTNILSIDTSLRSTISRRDTSEVTSPSQYFASSPPPPRFFSPPPSSSFGPVTAGLSRGSQGFTGSFSPFGSSTPPEMLPPQQQQQQQQQHQHPQQQQQQQHNASALLNEGSELFSPVADQSTTPNLENSRGG